MSRVSTPKQRFGSKVRQDRLGCITWISTKTPNGYGTFWLDRRFVLAHRFAWEQAHGQIPAGLTIDHLCRNRSCVKVTHLRLITGRENTLCGNGPTAQNARKTACHNGHPYTESSLYQYPSGKRTCRICRKERDITARAALAPWGAL